MKTLDDGTVLGPWKRESFKLTAKQLSLALPNSPKEHSETDAAALTEAFRYANVCSVAEAASFLGQIGWESGHLRYVRELWGPSKQQLKYDDPTQPLMKRLGNLIGDGKTFRGWGWLQITGRANTLAASLALFGDDRLVRDPKLLNDRAIAALGAAWYWKDRKLNDIVNAGDFRAVTRKINGAASDNEPSHHLARVAIRDHALEVLAA